MPTKFADTHKSTTSKLLGGMRRISAPKRKQPDTREMTRESTADWAAFPYTPSRSRTTAEPPSIEDIALGLHLSRTPHLRNPRRNVSLPTPTSPSHPRPPPPSALKKPSSSPTVHTYPVPPKSPESQSTSTLITTSPSVDSSTGSPKSRSGVARFFRLRVTPAAPSSSSSNTAADQDQQEDEEGQVKKKAVRFSTSALGLKDGVKADVA